MKFTRLFFVANVLLCLTMGATTVCAANAATAGCEKHIAANSKDVAFVVSDDSITWNGTPVRDLDELLLRTKDIAQITPQPDVRLCSDPLTKYERIANALLMFQRAGVSKLSFDVGGESIIMKMYSAASPTRPLASVVSIGINADGTTSWNGKAIPDNDTLEQNLQRAANDPNHPALSIHVNPPSQYNSVLSLVGLARKSGIDTIQVHGFMNVFQVSRDPDAPFAVRQPAPPPVAGFANINDCKPEYPRAALQAGQQGTVRIKFSIGADAKLIEATVIKSSGFPILDDAAVAGLSSCKFRSAFIEGRPVTSSFTTDYVWNFGK